MGFVILGIRTLLFLFLFYFWWFLDNARLLVN
jgi:hypothetical protein